MARGRYADVGFTFVDDGYETGTSRKSGEPPVEVTKAIVSRSSSGALKYLKACINNLRMPWTF